MRAVKDRRSIAPKPTTKDADWGSARDAIVGVAADIHVQKVTGAGPLVAVGGLPWRPCRAGEASSLEHLPERRVSETGEGGDQPRAPARLTAAGADLFLQLGGELAAGCHARRRVPLLAFDDYLSGRLMADVVLAARSRAQSPSPSSSRPATSSSCASEFRITSWRDS